MNVTLYRPGAAASLPTLEVALPGSGRLVLPVETFPDGVALMTGSPVDMDHGGAPCMFIELGGALRCLHAETTIVFFPPSPDLHDVSITPVGMSRQAWIERFSDPACTQSVVGIDEGDACLPPPEYLLRGTPRPGCHELDWTLHHVGAQRDGKPAYYRPDGKTCTSMGSQITYELGEPVDAASFAAVTFVEAE